MTKKDYAPDWGKIQTAYNWVAVDCDGEAFAYPLKPILVPGESRWFSTTDVFLYIEKVGWPDDGAWREMLYERPK